LGAGAHLRFVLDYGASIRVLQLIHTLSIVMCRFTFGALETPQ